MGKMLHVHSHMVRFSYVVFMLFSFVLNFSHQTFSHKTIKFIPGFQGELPFELETGYIGVGESEDVQLFYYFIKSDSQPTKHPLMLWLTGGPGCSSFTGLVFEIGPLKFDTEENITSFPTLLLNEFSWTKVANIIFLDLPVGTGFSYGRTRSASESSDSQACQHAYEFLEKFLINHPGFQSVPVYIGGDSYSGETVPRIAQLISDGIGRLSKPRIDLKGYVLGNPVSGGDGNYKIPFAHGMGLISDELYESLQRNCRGEYVDIDPSNILCLRDYDNFSEVIKGVNSAHILSPSCDLFGSQHKSISKRRLIRETIIELIKAKASPCPNYQETGYKLSAIWLNNPTVRKALGVQERTIGTWVRCNYDVPYTITTMDAFPYHVNLSSKGFRSLIYSGDHDMVVPFLGTQSWIRSLNYSIVDDWRRWLVQGQVAGYTRTYANQMTFATVKGGGHTAPEYVPRESFEMFKRWIHHQPL